MSRIESTNELPSRVWIRWVLVKDEAEARQIAGEQTSYLYHSKINNGLYLYIPVKESEQS